MMAVENDLSKKLKEAEKDAHEKWFSKWYGDGWVEKKLMEAATKGYKSNRLRIRELGKDFDKTEDNLWLINPLTVEKLKEKLPGIKVEYVNRERSLKMVFGEIKQYEDYILFDWEG